MIKIGIIGAGGMGQVHISNYAHIENCRVVALCDSSSNAKDLALKIGANCYDDLSEMLKKENPDILDVCTPTFLHKENVKLGLLANCHVICEKPLALNSSDANELYALAEKKEKLLFVGQVLQFSPSSLLLHEIVKNKTYGNVIDAEFLRLAAAPKWVKGGWLFDKSKSGLLPFDLHIHDVDLMISLFGAPNSSSYSSSGRSQIEYKEHYRFSYVYDDFTVYAQAAWYNADFPFTAEWRVCFENAVVTYDSQGLRAFLSQGGSKTYDIEEKVLIPTGINLPPTGMFLQELNFFLDYINSGKTAQYRKDEILNVLEILESIN